MATATVPLGPARLDITGVRAGDRNTFTMSITQDGEAYDLTGLTVTAQAREQATDAAPALTATITVLDAPGGEIGIAWPGDDVTTLLAGELAWVGVWDLQLAPAVGDPLTVCAGSFSAAMDVTRP